MFSSSPINITVEGKRHLGAAIGSQQYKNEYIDDKVRKWVSNIKALSEVAKTQPHAAYAAFIHGEQHKYTYFLRTIAGIADNLQPLDDAINNIFIPSLFGSEISEKERDLVILPIRDGGLGIKKLREYADISYDVSTKINKPLIQLILNQSDDLPEDEEVKKAKSEATGELRTIEAEMREKIKSSQETFFFFFTKKEYI